MNALNPLEYLKATGKRLYIGGRKNSSKWSGADLRAIRARNGVGRPPGHKS